MKSSVEYWNPLLLENAMKWDEVERTNGNILQLTLSKDEKTGDYTRLTKFKDGYSTKLFGAQSHNYPEEIFIVSGRLYDEAFDMWLESGHYACRPPFEKHGSFIAQGDVIVLEMSYPSQAI